MAKKPDHLPPMLGTRMKKGKMSSRPPNKKVLEQLGGTMGVKQSKLAQPSFGGNDPVGFTQTTERKATGGGPGKKIPKTPGQFRAMSAPGNNDFGLIGASAPAPMKFDEPMRKKKR